MDLLEDHAGRIWVAKLDAGLNRLDRDGAAFDRFLPDPVDRRSLSNASLLTSYQSRDGVLWVASREAGIPWGALDRVALKSPPF